MELSLKKSCLTESVIIKSHTFNQPAYHCGFVVFTQGFHLVDWSLTPSGFFISFIFFSSECFIFTVWLTLGNNATTGLVLHSGLGTKLAFFCWVYLTKLWLALGDTNT